MSGTQIMAAERNRTADRAAYDALVDIGAFIEGDRIQANWLADGRFWFVEGDPECRNIQVFDPATREATSLFDVGVLRAALSAAAGKALPYDGVPFESFHFTPDGAVNFSFDGDDYRFDPTTGTASHIPGPNLVDVHLGTDPKSRMTPKMMQRPNVFPDPAPVPETLSPDGRRFASLIDGDIYIRSVSDTRLDRLTFDAEPDFGWDVESVRMGLSSSGALMHLTVNPWSPDSSRLYATRFDQRRSRPQLRIRYLRHFDEVEQVQFARAGDALAETPPYVINIFSGAQVALDVDARNAFILLLGWNPGGDAVYLCRISRDMKRAEVIVADAATGAVRTLFSEEAETFLRIQHEVIGGRSGCTLLPNEQGFVWESERSGWKHLYHYDLDGNLVRQLTDGEWPVAEVLCVDPVKNWIYISAGIDQARPYDLHIARVPLAGGEVERLTTAPGVHEAQFAPDFSIFIDTVEGPGLPPRSRVIAADGKMLHEFPEADVSALIAAGWTPPEEFAVKAADGETELHGILFKPRDFDPSLRYPVIEYIYGGPQVAMVPRRFKPLTPSRMFSLPALAQLGYIVVVVDARGTPRRSKAFQDEVYGNWRYSVTADHAAALRNAAATRPWMDLDRVGIWGHSWGGYFTVANMLDNPELYRAGVASAPGFDPYSAFIYEPYLGGVPSPRTKAAYDEALLYTDAHKLEGALMIIAGMNDIGVWHSAVNMTNALIEAGKAHELVVMPEQFHGYATAHENMAMKKMFEHFERYLQRGEEVRL